MSLIAKLFGQCGKLRFEFVLYDGREGTGTINIESFNNDTAEIKEHIKNAIFVEEGYRVKSVTIIGFTNG